jgi:TP901 family phage tail tape measure protein
MSRAITIPSIFTAIDRFSAPVRAMGASVQGFAVKTESAIARADMALRKITPSIGELGKQILGFASVAAVGGLMVSSAQAVMDYEKSLASLSAITGVTGEAFGAFKSEVNAVALETKKSSIEVAKAFEIVGSAKPELLSSAAALGEVTKAALILSKASGDEVAASAVNLTGAMNAFGLGADQAQRTINALAAGSVVGSANIGLVNESLKNFGPVAAAANVSLEQSVALIEVMGSKSLFGAEAGTKLRGSLLKLQQAGVGYASGQFNINDALTEMKAKIDAVSTAKERDALITKTFGAENVTTGQILLSNIDLFNDYTKGVTGTNIANEQAATNSNTLSNRLAELQAAWVNMVTGSDQASGSLGIVKDIIVLVTDNLGTIVGVIGTVIATFIAWHGVLMLAKAGLFAYNAIANLVFLVQMVKYTAATQGLTFAQAALKIAQTSLNAAMAANPIGLIVIGIMAAIAVIVIIIKYWEQFGAAILMVGTIIAAFFAPVLGLFGLLVSVIASVWRNWDMIAQGFKDGGILGGLKAIGVTLMDAILYPLQQILSVAARLPGKMGQLAAEGAKSIEAFRADMGVNVSGGESATPEAVNPEASRQEALAQRMETVQKQNVSIDVRDSTGRASVESDNDFVPVTLTPTTRF